jgi:hypothetical protein
VGNVDLIKRGNKMIKVLKGYDGINHGTIVEVIERKGRNFGDRRKGEQLRYEVSYKGKWHVVFNLPKIYGELSGQCINLDSYTDV